MKSIVRRMLNRPGPRVPDRPDRWLMALRERRDRRLAETSELRPWFRVPRPLPCTAADVVISHSPKSGSTTMVDWYLAIEGRSRAARALGVVPHHYLESRLFWSPRFRRRLPIGENLATWTLLRVIRNPLGRLVASFRHAVRTGYADAELSSVAGRRIEASKGLSMDRFLAHLESVDLRNCNPHHAMQRSPVDELPFGRIVTIELDSTDLNRALAEFAESMGLPVVDLGTLGSTGWQRRVHHAPPDDGAGVEDLADAELLRHRFVRRDAQRQWPGRRLAALPEVQEAARRLYAPDWAWLETGGPSAVGDS